MTEETGAPVNDTLNRYLALNASFGSPFIFNLTDRGFYSEVTCLLGAVVFGLAHKRRLIVDETNFEGQRWSDFFDAELPTAPPSIVASVSFATQYVPAFDEIFRYVRRRNRSLLPLWIPRLGLFRSVYSAQRSLAFALTTPRTVPQVLPSPYAAFHIRRGDKTLGYELGGNLIKEGEAIGPDAYLATLQRNAPLIRSIFVMTDDYSTVEELRQVAPDFSISTLCQPEERGYRQTDFTPLSPASKAAKLHRLVEETQIAVASTIFVGGFKSNVAKFVALTHQEPTQCFSVDGRRKWAPPG